MKADPGGETAAHWPVRQRTLARSIEAEGLGVHSGKPAKMRLDPAPADSGVVFIRTDLPGAPEIPAAPGSVKKEMLRRMTVLEGAPGATVGMVEHLLAACAAMGLVNVRVSLSGFECPIFDGSGAHYTRLIREAGLREQEAPFRSWRLDRPVALLRENAELVALPAEFTRYTFFAEFVHAGMPDQQATFELFRDDWETEIAPARTFCFWRDVAGLFQAGLIQGGSTANAIVLHDGKPVRVRPDLKPEPDPDFAYRLPAELARHKLLDLIGDLAILGAPVRALISARASGHALHQEFASMLLPALVRDDG